MINSDLYNKSLDDWAKKGFTTSSLAKADLELMNVLDKKALIEREYINSARGRSTSL